jgi:S1-C subfamily serine protease
MSREITVHVPPGCLAICFEDSSSNDTCRTKISSVPSDSPLAETIFQGDLITSINGVDVHKIDASGET